MPIQCVVNVLLARENVKRAEAGEHILTNRELAMKTGIAPSALNKLINGESTRVDFETLEKLMEFFGTYNLNDILVRVPEVDELEVDEDRREVFDQSVKLFFDRLREAGLYGTFADSAERRINREGARQAISYYVRMDTRGFRNSVKAGRFDLTFEYLVIQFPDLFPEVIEKVRERLTRYGYDSEQV